MESIHEKIYLLGQKGVRYALIHGEMSSFEGVYDKIEGWMSIYDKVESGMFSTVAQVLLCTGTGDSPTLKKFHNLVYLISNVDLYMADL